MCDSKWSEGEIYVYYFTLFFSVCELRIANAKILHSFHFNKYFLVILTILSKNGVLWGLTFGFFGFFS